jgi:ABC-2 type transport system ATP-binding protein
MNHSANVHEGPALLISGLTKRYGRLTALEDLNLSLSPGEVFGFIGPNGAGKSTTMKIVAGLLQATSGSARVLGQDVATQGDFIRRHVGYMPDAFGVYDDLTVTEYLQFFASAYGLERSDRRKRVGEVLDLTELRYKEHARVEGLSRGMQQRLGLARVLIHDPPLLLLDEPASGLDPRARIEIRELLKHLRTLGKTIVVSSHILSELAEFSTSLGIIERGKLLVHGSLAELTARAKAHPVVVVTTPSPEGAKQALANDSRVTRIEMHGTQLRVTLDSPETHLQFVIEKLIAAGVRIDAIAPENLSVEEVFLRLTRGVVN